MIVLDTNVLSEMMKREKCERAVTVWLDSQQGETIWLTSISVFEIRFGIELLSRGRRRDQLERDFIHAVESDFQSRVLAFDSAAAEEAAAFLVRRRSAGRPVEYRDVQIAGIAAAHGATLATRNMRDFQDFAIDTVNPWIAA